MPYSNTRALAFVVEMVHGVRAAADGDSMAVVARATYDRTLGLYHSWLVRRVVHLALHMLPNRKKVLRDPFLPFTSSVLNYLVFCTQLITKLAGKAVDDGPFEIDMAEAGRHMDTLVECGTRVYDACQAILLHYKCTELC